MLKSESSAVFGSVKMLQDQETYKSFFGYSFVKSHSLFQYYYQFLVFFVDFKDGFISLIFNNNLSLNWLTSVVLSL
jgi:hypothetical protein